MKAFPFTKMQALGNDFVVIETLTQDIPINSELITKLADRRLGIGCDQVLVLSKSTNHADFNYNIYNADGSEAAHCGNGARCLAKFIHDNKFSNQSDITLQLPKHIISAELISDHVIKISMGEPEFAMPFSLGSLMIYPVSIGNPHAVIFSENPHPNLTELGLGLNQDQHFPEGVNVSWALIRDPKHIDLHVFERGVGLTPACGSAACATAALAINQKLCEGSVIVSMPGGDCTVEWPRKSSLYLSGPATTVYSGIWHG
jgi:diaminopimelate epimerase